VLRTPKRKAGRRRFNRHNTECSESYGELAITKHFEDTISQGASQWAALGNIRPLGKGS